MTGAGAQEARHFTIKPGTPRGRVDLAWARPGPAAWPGLDQALPGPGLELAGLDLESRCHGPGLACRRAGLALAEPH